MITKNETKQIKVEYTVEEDGLTYMDTLLFDEKDFSSMEEGELEQLIDQKFIVWKDYIETPTPVPTKEDKEAEILQLQKQIADAEIRKAKLESEVK